MALPIVTELTEPPVVGRYYLVPCVKYRYDFKVRWWPVVGPKHDDAEHLNFAAVHYHLDRRFLPMAMLRGGYAVPTARGIREGKRIWRSSDTMLAARPLSEVTEYGPLPTPELRKRLCIVSDVGFPGRAREGLHSNFDRLHEAYEGRRCGRNAEGQLICPHKGAVLSNLAADRNGIVTCPLHGLNINTQTGVVVKRPRVGGDQVR